MSNSNFCPNFRFKFVKHHLEAADKLSRCLGQYGLELNLNRNLDLQSMLLEALTFLPILI